MSEHMTPQQMAAWKAQGDLWIAREERDAALERATAAEAALAEESKRTDGYARIAANAFSWLLEHDHDVMAICKAKPDVLDHNQALREALSGACEMIEGCYNYVDMADSHYRDAVKRYRAALAQCPAVKA